MACPSEYRLTYYVSFVSIALSARFFGSKTQHARIKGGRLLTFLSLNSIDC